MNYFLYASCIVLFFLGCTESSIKGRLDTYEQDIEQNPQATYELLNSICDETPNLNTEDEARLALLTIKAKNLARVELEKQDTLRILNAIQYYRKKRDVKKQMLCYYLLGSIYRDLGDAPRGVEAFMKVIEVADTTDGDCDYRLMARAEGQKSDLQLKQSVISKAIESSIQAGYYAWKARDTSFALNSTFETIGRNALNGNYEPLLIKLPYLIKESLRYGDTLVVIRKSISFAWYYLQLGMVEEADSMLRLYDRYSGKGYPIYYGTKGELALAHQRLDSAEWLFRKELEATDWNNRQAAYRGLKKVFERRHQVDSALKYATLQCEAVDSDYRHKVSENLIRTEQVYNYEAEKERARQSEAERERLRWMLTLGGMSLLSAAALALFAFQRYRNIQVKKQLEQEQQNARLKLQLVMKNQQLAEEQQRVEEMRNTMEDFKEDIQLVKNLGEGIQQMRLLLEKKKPAMEQDWVALEKQIRKMYPDFVQTLRNRLNPLLENELRLAMLIKVGFKPAQMAVLMSQTPSAVAKARNRFYEKLFGRKPESPSELDDYIMTI